MFWLYVISLIDIFSLSHSAVPEVFPSHFSSLFRVEGRYVADRHYVTAYLNVSHDGHYEISEIGKFAYGHTLPATGRLLYIKPNHTNGCNFAKDIQDPEMPWIGLLRSGDCDIHLTIRSAQKINLSGLIIYNERNSSVIDEIPIMLRSNISVVFTYLWKGEQLAGLIERGSNVSVQISIANVYSEPPTAAQRSTMLICSLSFIAAILVSFGWLVYYYVHRFRYVNAKDRLSKRDNNEVKQAISHIPTRSVQNEDKEMKGENECCAVCIEHYKLNDTIRDLPCRHVFHKSCIDPWLVERRTCPMCKVDVLRLYGFVFTGSQESILPIDMDGGLEDTDNPEDETSTTVELTFEMQNDVIELQLLTNEPTSSAYSYTLANPNAAHSELPDIHGANA